METNQSLLAAIREAIRGPGWTPGRRAVEGAMPPLDGATGWLNSPPLTTDFLRGRVVAVDFWTYTCINWLRTAPYVRAWNDAYRDAGLVVLGVHTPEFPFEREDGNVRRAIADRRITYPVAVDNDYAVWTAFANMYWPALYVVGALSTQATTTSARAPTRSPSGSSGNCSTRPGAGRRLPPPVTVEASGIEATCSLGWASARQRPTSAPSAPTTSSPRNAPGSGTSHHYTSPPRLVADSWALGGAWTLQPDAVRLDEAGGRIGYRFTARDLNLVMAPPASDIPVRFTVRIDGQPPGPAAGVDVDDYGTGTLSCAVAVPTRPSARLDHRPHLRDRLLWLLACGPTPSRSADPPVPTRNRPGPEGSMDLQPFDGGQDSTT